MMNANVLEGLKLIYKGIEEILKSASQNEENTEVETKKPTAKKSAKKTEEVVETENESEELTEEELNSMSYNDLKKLAKELGISATGSRKELVNKLLNSDAEEAEEEEEAPAPKKSSKKASKKEEPVEEEEEEESEDGDDESDEEEDLASQIEAALEDMEDDELKDILDEAGIPSKGKRQALITKIIHAVEDGVIELDLEDDDDEDETEDEEPDTDESEDEVEETEDDEDEEEESEDITAKMTKKRRKAYDAICEETSESFENGELEREDLIDFINEYNGTKDKMKKVSDEDLLEQYLKIAALFIDDDGNEVEEGAYYVNDEPYCCGRPLKFDKKKKQYVCESCGSKYDEE